MRTSNLGLFAVLALFFNLSMRVPLASAEVVSPRNYDFPVKNPYLATILSVVAHATTPYEVLQVPLRSDREPIPLALFAQSARKAPLAFVISGTGSDALAGGSLYMASELFNLGYHVITLPNPISSAYVKGMSESTVPGYLPRDSREFYQFLQGVVSYLKTRHRLAFDGYSVIGFSYGALLAGFLAQIDQAEKSFNFDRVVIFNPAVDVDFGVKTLDRFYDWGNVLPLRNKDIGMKTLVRLENQSLGMGYQDNVDLLGWRDQVLNELSNEVMKWLIGRRFREKLLEVILAGQSLKDTGILRQNEASAFSFRDYIEQFVAPTVPSRNGRPTKPEILTRKASLYTLAGTLSALPSVYLFESTDDFLLKTGDVDFLKSMMGERLYLYPYGGHIGNLTFDKNRRDFQAVMTGRK